MIHDRQKQHLRNTNELVCHSSTEVMSQACVNSSPPSAAYMRQSIGSALVQMMACRLFGAKPLSKPMLGYCQLDP